MSKIPTQVPVTTEALPAAGGQLGPEPEHFIVEEVPAYVPSGEGDHVYLWIEKRGQNTREVTRRLAKFSGEQDRNIGYAGMKDRHAVTRQWFSVPSSKDLPEKAEDWDLGEDVKVLSLSRHKNKLRTGHLIGNLFEITLVGIDSEALVRAEAIVEALQTFGLLNFYGPQRFGREGRNLETAWHWLEQELATPAAELDEADLKKKKRRSRRNDRRGPDPKLLSSVLQSEFFNRYLIKRNQIEAPLLLGEVVRLNGTGSHFVVENLEQELPRRQAGDLHLTGAMFGPKTVQSAGDAAAIEAEVRAEMGLGQAEIDALARHAPGARRDLHLMPENLELKAGADSSLILSFGLPSGSFATQVVRELTRSEWLKPRPDA